MQLVTDHLLGKRWEAAISVSCSPAIRNASDAMECLQADCVLEGERGLSQQGCHSSNCCSTYIRGSASNQIQHASAEYMAWLLSML